MRHYDDLLFIEDPTIDDVSDLLQILPEIRQRVSRRRADDGVGLRSLLERPEALSKAWRRSARTRTRTRGGAKHPAQRSGVLRAA